MIPVELFARLSPRPNVFSPLEFDPTAGQTDFVNDDTAALQWAIAKAVAAPNGAVDLGAGSYRVTAALGTLITTPIAIYGDGPAQCWILMDQSLSGDLLSFSNCWYGADVTNAAGGGVDAGSTGTSVGWPGKSSRKSGVVLRGFSVVGNRGNSATQNGIMFYDRNDAAQISDLDFHFIKGHALMLSGKASNRAANAAFLMRESSVKNVHVRWCGDRLTGRIPVTLDSQDKGAVSNDDNCNYNRIENLKIIFADGPAFSQTSHNVNNNAAHHGNVIDLIVDFPQNVSSAEVNSTYSSISGGVLTVASGATVTRSLAVGQYLTNQAVPLGTYISAILTGSGGVGTYQLANNTIDVSALAATSGDLFVLRPSMHFIHIGGGHVAEHWTVEGNASNTLGSGCGLIDFNHNALDAETAKTRQCKLYISIGSMDKGMVFTVINSLSVNMMERTSVTSITALSVTQKVSVNIGQELFDARLAIGGQREKIVVHCDGEQIVTSLPPAEKYPGATFLLESGGTWQRYVSVADVWELVT
jgi:hypothetical protein